MIHEVANKEQAEAEQESINNERREILKNLPEEERKKFKAVDDAMDILTQNGILAYVFPYLGGTDAGKDVWQYNNFSRFIEFNENEVGYTKEGKDLLQRFHLLFFSGAMSLFPGEILREKDFTLYWNKTITYLMCAQQFRIKEYKKNEV